MNNDESKSMIEELVSKAVNFRIGDKILRYVSRRARKKFNKVWTGPYVIEDILGEYTVKLSNGSIVNVNDIKTIEVEMKGLDVFVNDDLLGSALSHWNLEEEKFEEQFRTAKDAWMIDWTDRNILVVKKGIDLMDLILKIFNEPCNIVTVVLNDKSIAFKAFSLFPGEWIELPRRDDVWVTRDGKSAGAEVNDLWIVLLRVESVRKIVQDWESNVENFINHAQSAKMQEKFDEEEIFKRSDELHVSGE